MRVEALGAGVPSASFPGTFGRPLMLAAMIVLRAGIDRERAGIPADGNQPAQLRFARLLRRRTRTRRSRSASRWRRTAACPTASNASAFGDAPNRSDGFGLAHIVSTTASLAMSMTLRWSLPALAQTT